VTDSSTVIARRSISIFAVAALTSALSVAPQQNSQQGPASRPQDRFVSVKGVKLHYLDWGGHGQVLLFLTGLGDSAHRFDSFAPKFIDHFHVLGLTRRGQGQSDKAPSGYDTGTLVEDIRGFLDVMQIERVALVGHSIAGVEMTRFAGLYAQRVSKLVYLDAASDWARMHELMAEAHVPYPTYLNEFHEAIDTNQSHPDLTKVTTPALAFFVIFGAAPITPQDDEAVKRFWQLMYEKDFWNEQAELFRKQMRRGQVITLHDTNHFFFQDPKRRDEVVREIRKFLLD
jgi:pimeloyl-ACP methyl ester carboxylesterase